MRADIAGLTKKLSLLNVIYDGHPVGTLAQTDDGVLAFEYEDSWIEDGFSISPLSLPLEKRLFVAEREPLDGVFGVFADSMPDGWGRLLVDRTLKSHGIDPNTVSALMRLSLVGANGMGALEYVPDNALDFGMQMSDLDSIAEECAELLETDYSDNLDALFDMGGSSGGARPKILTTIDGDEWIIKFPSSLDSANIGAEECTFAQQAVRCGVKMSEVRLFPSKRCKGYFGTKRFDRCLDSRGRVNKIHMVSAAGLLETTHRVPNLSYETLMKLTWRLTDSMEDIEGLFRLMCFNVHIGNRDDHSKNFSYLYDEDAREWHLSPAYDLTQNPGIAGEHTTTVRGKGRDIGVDDLVAVGVDAGIKASRAKAIAEEILQS